MRIMTKTKDIIGERCVWKVALEHSFDQTRNIDLKCYYCRGYRGSAIRNNCDAYRAYTPEEQKYNFSTVSFTSPSGDNIIKKMKGGK